jgi:hypothetical protein
MNMTPAEPCKFHGLISSLTPHADSAKTIFQHGLAKHEIALPIGFRPLRPVTETRLPANGCRLISGAGTGYDTASVFQISPPSALSPTTRNGESPGMPGNDTAARTEALLMLFRALLVKSTPPRPPLIEIAQQHSAGCNSPYGSMPCSPSKCFTLLALHINVPKGFCWQNLVGYRANSYIVAAIASILHNYLPGFFYHNSIRKYRWTSARLMHVSLYRTLKDDVLKIFIYKSEMSFATSCIGG